VVDELVQYGSGVRPVSDQVAWAIKGGAQLTDTKPIIASYHALVVAVENSGTKNTK